MRVFIIIIEGVPGSTSVAANNEEEALMLVEKRYPYFYNFNKKVTEVLTPQILHKESR